MSKIILDPDRYFSPDPSTRAVARDLYETVAKLPLVCPHGHVDPRLFAEPDATFGSPADLFIIPDHYVTRMLYSQGIALESLGVWKDVEPRIARSIDLAHATGPEKRQNLESAESRAGSEPG